MEYHFCSYWGTWSRRLSENHPIGPFVEVNLTPIPNSYSSTWQSDVAPIRIRAHGTASAKRDINTDTLPDDVRAAMIKNLGLQLTERLLTEDFLSQIDFDTLHTNRV
jgi:hypothetical protein